MIPAEALTRQSLASDPRALGALRREARDGSPAALEQTAKQFEAVFIQQMLKAMRAASPAAGGAFDNDAGRLYRDLGDQQLAQNLAGRFGIAELLLAQLGGRQAPRSQPAGGQQLEGALRRIERVRTDAGLDAVEATSTVPFKPGTPDAFVREVWPHARAAARSLGVDPAVLVAQAALESNWGRATPRHADGRNSHNLFGIKADRVWTGPRAVNATLEFEGGVAVRRSDGFRAYPSFAESFRDYADFIRGNPRYSKALAVASDSAAYLRELARAGYATDPGYAGKIQRILGGDTLAGLKSAAARPISLATTSIE